MRKTILQTLLFSLLIFALSCSSCDEDDEIIAFPTFTGFSLTDDNGQALSNPDTTDWRVDDSWEQEEKGLFEFPDLPLCSGDGAVSPVYPNPCGNVLNFRFVSSASTMGYFRVVDKDFNVLIESDSVPFEAGPKIISLNFSTVVADTVRLYYRIVNGNCEYRGHGDVLVQ